MRKKRWMYSLAACLLYIFCLIPAAAANAEADSGAVPDELSNLYATAAVLMDGDTGRVLFGKNEQEVLPMASTTKILTCILTLENADLDDVVEVSEYADSMPEVALGIKAGEKYYLKDLMYSMMLESHNDSAVAIAEHVGGSVQNFAAMMNEKAAEIGCQDSYFITPNGLDAEETDASGNVRAHSTTAKDLALILRYCIKQSPQREKFLEITKQNTWLLSSLDGTRSFSCYNHNAFLSMMSGASAGKTGFTGKAGYCYVGSLVDGDRTFIVALLACGWPNNKSYKWSDTKALMNYGLSRYSYRNVYEPHEYEPLNVLNGIGKNERLYEPASVPIGLMPEDENVPIQLLLRDDEQVTVSYDISQPLHAPVSAGQIVGQVSYKLGGETIKTCQIVTKDNVEKIDLKWCVKKVAEQFLNLNAP